ncbi:MAG: hypothetical protein MUF82_03275 [Bacteroidetes bacterium]|nr:hypothetical protein [Bacteroidota bacterium]
MPSGAYSYMSFDSSGTAIVKGWFTLTMTDSSHVTGEWNFMEIVESTESSLQTGHGALAGGFSNGRLIVDLHPDYRDNNLLLIGTVDGTGYSGRWEWISFAGVSNYGTFHAQRR